jgi:hypothetical protein
MTIGNHGAQLFPAALSLTERADLRSALGAQLRHHAGVRLTGIPELLPLLTPAGTVGQIPAVVLGPQCLPVRAILFDKSADRNWSVGWHQDRTIAVQQRIEAAGFGRWSIKSGLLHVEPPFEILAAMLTVRVHLDAVPATNAPLLIAPGSHRRGRIPEAEVMDVVGACGVARCLAAPGDIWLYATSILHASDAAVEPLHRRVLQVDYAAAALPGGLQWLGI